MCIGWGMFGKFALETFIAETVDGTRGEINEIGKKKHCDK